VIVSSNPLIRPNDFGIPWDELDADLRTVRNVRLPWSEVKDTTNPLWEEGFNLYFMTPKTRHTVHSSWAVVDWNVLWASNFADPHRSDPRLPSVGDQQVHMNPEDARALGLADGDYVYIDANPRDRPYRGASEDDPFYKVARLIARVKFNPAYPRGITMMKHGSFIATEKTVAAHESRPDGRALSADTGYQSNFRYGSHQSVTRDWAMPMHQTDTLFHKAKVATGFLFGGEADNHAVNTVPKETLIRITKAADGGLGDQGLWTPGTTGKSPGGEDDMMRRYIAGDLLSL
ncbi:MAG TPA: nitrate oxidoreductase subunit alpha, partial [Dehalococcoidia bacterium]|nr:nitrate oxidoreductase subunit alpha [Dehalococcoidia bacterium]